MNMKQHINLAIFLFFLSTSASSQLTISGITKISAFQASKSVNGTWNKYDNTGNVLIDKYLNKFAATYTFNPKGITALERTAAGIKTNPAAFLNPDGSVNKQALQDLITSKFAAVGEVTVPSIAAADQEEEGQR